MHAAQHRVAAGLQRHVRVLGDARRGSDQRDQFVRPIHRLDATRCGAFRAVFLESMARSEMLEIRLPAFGRAARSRPQRPRLMPLITTSR